MEIWTSAQVLDPLASFQVAGWIRTTLTCFFFSHPPGSEHVRSVGSLWSWVSYPVYFCYRLSRRNFAVRSPQLTLCFRLRPESLRLTIKFSWWLWSCLAFVALHCRFTFCAAAPLRLVVRIFRIWPFHGLHAVLRQKFLSSSSGVFWCSFVEQLSSPSPERATTHQAPVSASTGFSQKCVVHDGNMQHSHVLPRDYDLWV